MSAARVSAIVSTVVLGGLASVHAQDRSFWSFLKPGTVVTRCAASSPAHRQASASLENLNEQIQRLSDTQPHANVVEQLHALLRTDCFLLASETDRVPAPDTAASLKEWWIKGGHDWLESFLALPRLGFREDLKPHVAVPPDARKTLTLEAHRDHPLQTLLCPTSDASCGAATRGWRARAEAQFEVHRALGRREGLTTRRAASAWSQGDVRRVRAKGRDR